MAIKTIETLKSYFFERAYPTWQQFYDVLDSFRHKSDKLAITDVDDLADQLNGRVTSSQLDQEIQDRKAGDGSLQADLEGKANASDLEAEVQARTDADSALQTILDAKASSADLASETRSRTEVDSNIIERLQTEITQRSNEDSELHAEVAIARSIAEGRSQGKVFDTVDAMNAWLAISTNTATLNIGDNLLIKALDVPDYWWDGTSAQKLETEKVDLTDYVQKERKINGHDLSVDINLTADDIAETGSRGWLTATLKAAYDGAVSWISTNGANLVAHLSDAVVHITATERAKWNAATVIQGTSFIFVPGNDTAANNATALQAAYTAAKSKTPFGSALSATNRYTILIGAGKYTFSSTFTVDAQYIDIVSLTGKADVFLNGISVTANDVLLRGINCGPSAFKIATNLNLLKCEYCTGGDYSFGGSSISGVAVTTSGTFTNCTAGSYSFGCGYMALGTASGTFTNCTATGLSFGSGNSYSGTASGIFINCTASNYSFGGGSSGIGTASGTFTNCTATSNSFGGSSSSTGTASGTFTNCTATTYSFGSGYSVGNSCVGTASGTFTNCTAGNYSFGYGYNNSGGTGCTGTASGIFNNCTAGDSSFGYGSSSTASGSFTNCKSGTSSFGYHGTLTGTFNNCTAGNYSFGIYGTVSGIFVNCTAGSSSFGYYGTASGTFTNCIGTTGCFGGFGIASGTFTNCIATADSFGGGWGGTGTATGTFVDCIGGATSFGYANASGIFTGCTGGDYAFGYLIASGTFTDCVGGNNSFGWTTASGIFTNCVSAGSGCFGYTTASGTFTNCTGGASNFGGAGNNCSASGTFTNCTGGAGCFGGYNASGIFTNCTGGSASFGSGNSIAATARLYYCRMTSGNFTTPISGARFILCIDGNNNTVTI